MPDAKPHQKHEPKIAVLDAGGQYCHLIARKVRELGVYAEIFPSGVSSSRLAGYDGIIISGGPASVFAEKKPDVDRGLFDLKLPVLGICYGHQIMANALGGKVRKGLQGEYGIASLNVTTPDSLFKNLNKTEPVWMNHRDVVERVPDGFSVIGMTDDCAIAGMANPNKRFFGIQFHPEVVHTKNGKEILKNFVQGVCGCPPGAWNPAERIGEFLANIRKTVGEHKKVFFLVSGGVDSTVAFALCVKALGKDRVRGLYVDTGFMRKYDNEAIGQLADAGMDNIHVVDASKEFIELLERTYSPEEKRKKIGKKFFDVTERVLEHELNLSRDEWLLGQGTIYPDTIESGGSKHAARIKTHHNRVSVIQKLIREGKIVEPLRDLYKDEVREIGEKLAEEFGLPKTLIYRHPFPGPGLAIRCLASRSNGLVSEHEVLDGVAVKFGLTSAVLNLHTVGVRGDERSYDRIAVIAGDIPSDYVQSIADLESISTAITNNSGDINRVTYCVTHDRFLPEEWMIKRAFITRERIELLREADDIVLQFMARHSLLTSIWQFPVVVIPLARKEAGGDTIVLRPVESVDGMTAQFTKLEIGMLHELAKSIMTLKGVEAVLLDVTNKPPATIEWE